MSTTPTSVLDYLDTVAVLAAGLFAGTAFYLTISQTPALRQFGLNEHWRFFPYMFKRTAIPQASLTLIAGTAGIIHGTRILGSPFHRNLWIVAGSTFLAVIPYTMLGLEPINRVIIDDNKSVKSGNESQINISKKKELLDKWTALNVLRTVGSVAAFGVMVFGLSRHTSLVLGW